MQNSIIEAYENKKFSDMKELPEFRPGDTVQVDFEIVESGEKSRSRVQSFQGVVLKYKKGKIDGTFTVRKMGANGIGVERSFPTCSPNIKGVKVVSQGVVRRSRLFYLRERSGKSARIRSRQVHKS